MTHWLTLPRALESTGLQSEAAERLGLSGNGLSTSNCTANGRSAARPRSFSAISGIWAGLQRNRRQGELPLKRRERS